MKIKKFKIIFDFMETFQKVLYFCSAILSYLTSRGVVMGIQIHGFKIIKDKQ